MKLISEVKGFEGRCKFTWRNESQLDNRLDGGVSGFFKLINRFGFKIGKEFHGFIWYNTNKVITKTI